MKKRTVTHYIANFLVFIVGVLIVTILSIDGEILKKWNVRWWLPFGESPESPGLLCFLNEQIRLEKNLLPVDSILPSKKVPPPSINIFVIDQTTPDLYETEQYQNFKDFNDELENLCDTRFIFMQNAYKSRKSIGNSFHFYDAIGFYLLANSLVQHEDINFCVLDYFGGKNAPFSPRITGSNTCTQVYCEKICTEFISGPKNRPSDALKRSDFADLLTNVKNYLLNNLQEDTANNLPIEITFISDFVHETTTRDYGSEPRISIQYVNQKFSELLDQCPRIKSMNFVKLPMRIRDLHLAQQTRDMLNSFIQRFKNGDTSPDLIEIDNLGNSSDCIDWLNTYSAENSKQIKPIRVFTPYYNGGFNGVGKGLFSVSTLGDNIEDVQLCLEASCLDNLNLVITKHDGNNIINVHIPQKSEFVNLKTPGSDTLSITVKDVETINPNTNAVLRIIVPKRMPTKALKYESISFPVHFMPRMSRSVTEWVGYFTLMALVGMCYLVMDFVLRLLTSSNYIVFFQAFSLAFICYLIMKYGLSDFPYRIPFTFIAFVLPFIPWGINNSKYPLKKIENTPQQIDHQVISPQKKSVKKPKGSSHPPQDKLLQLDKPNKIGKQLSEINPQQKESLTKTSQKEMVPESSAMPPNIQTPNLDILPPLYQTGLEEKATSEPKRLYVRMPSGNTFYSPSKIFEPNMTFFVLTISLHSSKMATISLVDDPETREYFLTRMRGLQNVCELRGKGIPKLEDVIEIQPGSARQSKAGWVMEKQIILDW